MSSARISLLPAVSLLVLALSAAIVSASEPRFRRGDANSDGQVDLSDPVRTLGVLFLGEASGTCDAADDSNDDGTVNISDPVWTLGFLFLGGPAPPAPYPDCGPDPSSDGLSCATAPAACPSFEAGCRDGVQSTGSIYRICMPEPDLWNGRLVVWAHGFQDAGEPVAIPEDQMQFADISLPDLMTGLGFAFATNSYSKTGLAVRQGVDDILDLVELFEAAHGTPVKTYVTGASEGGIITALLVEGFPDVFAGGVAACGPVGDWERQMRFFGDTRVLFEYFFPGLIPGDPFAPSVELRAGWSARYATTVEPALLAPGNRRRLEQLVATASLPVDPANWLSTAEVCVRDALRYAVVNTLDAAATLGGFPFENRETIYTGSDDDLALNAAVIRVAADPAAVVEMRTRYDTTGRLTRPLITIHTIYDSQVPQDHEVLYSAKCTAEGSEGVWHWDLTAERFGHCSFTEEEVRLAFGLLLLKAGDADLIEGWGAGGDARGDRSGSE